MLFVLPAFLITAPPLTKAARQKNSCGELLLRVLFQSQEGVCQIVTASYLRLGLWWPHVTVTVCFTIGGTINAVIFHAVLVLRHHVDSPERLRSSTRVPLMWQRSPCVLLQVVLRSAL